MTVHDPAPGQEPTLPTDPLPKPDPHPIEPADPRPVSGSAPASRAEQRGPSGGSRSMKEPDPEALARRDPHHLQADIQGGQSVGTGLQRGGAIPAGRRGKADEIDPGAGGESPPPKQPRQ